MKSKPCYFVQCLLALLLVLSACGERPDPVLLQPGGCGLLVTLHFGPRLPESTGHWQGHLEVTGAQVSLLKTLELEAGDQVPWPTGNPLQLGWNLTTETDRDGLTARILPNPTLENSDLANTDNEIQIHIVDDLNQKTLEYKYVQLKDGFENHNPIDNEGWTHALDIETRFVPGACP